MHQRCGNRRLRHSRASCRGAQRKLVWEVPVRVSTLWNRSSMTSFALTKIPGVLEVQVTKHGDERGFFSEVFRRDSLAAAGITLSFVQDNHSRSVAAGVLRGLHFQTSPSEQGKLVRVVKGAILDVAVDIRHGSPTFGQHVAVELSDRNWKQLWVPPGLAHGFVTLEPDTEVLYKVTSYYDPAADKGLAFDDPNLNIDWRFRHSDLMLSDKDRRHPPVAQLPPYFSYSED